MWRKCHHRMNYTFSIHIHFLQDADRVPFNFYTETWQGRRMMTNWQGRIEESKWRRSSSTGALFVLNQTEKLVLSCPCRRNKRGKISLLCFCVYTTATLAKRTDAVPKSITAVEKLRIRLWLASSTQHNCFYFAFKVRLINL